MNDEVMPIKLDNPDQMVDDVIAWAKPAKQQDVEFVLQQEIETGDGRSDWFWVRLTNGDLLLGTFPQGATYEALEISVEM